jgi:hypothetical protein
LNDVLLRLAMGRQRAIPYALLVIATSFCQSCEQKPFAGYLAGHTEKLMNLTVPAGAINVSREGVKRTKLSESCFWEFDVKLERAKYEEWVTNKLRGEFNLAKTSGDALAFSKNLGSDAETIILHLSPDHENLHVRVDVNVFPD